MKCRHSTLQVCWWCHSTVSHVTEHRKYWTVPLNTHFNLLQSNWSSLMKPGPTRTTSLNHTSAPSLTRTRAPSVNSTRSPSLNSTSAPSVSTGPGSKWARFLSSDCQVTEEREEPSASGWSQSASLSCNDIIHQAPPLTRPRPPFPVSSMFQSGDDFSFDEFDSWNYKLTDQSIDRSVSALSIDWVYW